MSRRIVRTLALLAMPLALAAPVAGAVPMDVGDGTYTAGQGWNVSGIVDGRMTWAGALAADISAWDVPGSVPFCLQSGPIAPTGPTTQQGLLDDPPLAYALWRYQHVDTPDSRAALAFLVHVRHDTGTATVSAETRRQQWAEAITGRDEFTAVEDIATAYLAEAAALAGPYAAGALALDVAADGRSATVTGLGLRAASGAWLGGQPFSATLTGPAVWADGTTTATGVTGVEPVSMAVRLTGAGTVTAAVTVETPPVALASGNLGATTQAVAAVHRPGSVAATATAQVAPQFTPTITSDVAADSLAAGERLVDVLHIDGEPDWPADVELVVDVVAYGPFDTPPGQRPDLPDLAPAAEAAVTVVEPGDVTVDLGPVTAPGFYTVVASVLGADQTEFARRHLAADLTTQFGDPAETAVVRWTPSIDTSAVVTEDATTDSVTISGLPDEPFAGDENWLGDAEAVVQTLFGPFESAPGAQDCTSDMVRWTTTVPARNGVHEVSSPGELAPGWYTWTSSLDAGGRADAAVTTCGLPAETVQIVAPPPPPPPVEEELPVAPPEQPEQPVVPEQPAPPAAPEQPVLPEQPQPEQPQPEQPQPEQRAPQLADTGAGIGLAYLAFVSFALSATAFAARAALRRRA